MFLFPESITLKDCSYTVKELIELLIRDQGLHEGYFDISVNFGIMMGGFLNPHGHTCPSAVVAIEGIGLRQVPELAGAALDAAVVNPAKKKRSSSRAAS